MQLALDVELGGIAKPRSLAQRLVKAFSPAADVPARILRLVS